MCTTPSVTTMQSSKLDNTRSVCMLCIVMGIFSAVELLTLFWCPGTGELREFELNLCSRAPCYISVWTKGSGVFAGAG